jgi:serine/threonine protein kinase
MDSSLSEMIKIVEIDTKSMIEKYKFTHLSKDIKENGKKFVISPNSNSHFSKISIQVTNELIIITFSFPKDLPIDYHDKLKLFRIINLLNSKIDIGIIRYNNRNIKYRSNVCYKLMPSKYRHLAYHKTFDESIKKFNSLKNDLIHNFKPEESKAIFTPDQNSIVPNRFKDFILAEEGPTVPAKSPGDLKNIVIDPKINLLYSEKGSVETENIQNKYEIESQSEVNKLSYKFENFRSPYDTKFDLNAISIQDLVEIDQKFYKYINQYYLEIIKIESVVCYQNNPNKLYYLPDKSKSLYVAKTGLINIDTKNLEKFMDKLVKKIEYIERFPIKSIEYETEISDDNQAKYKLGFFNLQKYTGKDSNNKKEFYKEYIKFLLDLIKIKRSPSLYPGKLDQLNLEEFEDYRSEYPFLEKEERLLGKGGFGSVYKSTYCGLDVAIKLEIIKKDQAKSTPNIKPNTDSNYNALYNNRNRFNYSEKKLMSEFIICKNMIHPNIVKTLGYIKYQNKFGIVLEYCERESVSKYYRKKPAEEEKKNSSAEEFFRPRNPKESPKNVIRIKTNNSIDSHEGKLNLLLNIAYSIQFLHLKKIAHFDIKPHNIFLNNNLRPKIGDFGLSKKIISELDKKTSGCSLYYSPPEQIINDCPDFSCDIWGLGMIMFYVLLSEHPFEYLKLKLHKEIDIGRSQNNQKKELGSVEKIENSQDDEKNQKDYKKEERHNYYTNVYSNLKRPIINQSFERDYSRETALMRECWNYDKNKRPKINQIVKQLKKVIKFSGVK